MNLSHKSLFSPFSFLMSVTSCEISSVPRYLFSLFLIAKYLIWINRSFICIQNSATSFLPLRKSLSILLTFSRDFSGWHCCTVLPITAFVLGNILPFALLEYLTVSSAPTNEISIGSSLSIVSSVSYSQRQQSAM